MTTTEPAFASGPPLRDEELTAFRDRVSALARSAHGRGVEGAPALSPDEIDQQRDRMLAALFPLSRENARATTPGADRGREPAEPHCGNDPDVTRLAYAVVEALAAHPSEPRIFDRSDKAASRVAAAFAKALGTPYLNVLGDRLRALAAPAEIEADGRLEACRALVMPDRSDFPLTCWDNLICGNVVHEQGDDCGATAAHVDAIELDDVARLAATPPAPEGEAACTRTTTPTSLLDGWPEGLLIVDCDVHGEIAMVRAGDLGVGDFEYDRVERLWRQHVGTPAPAGPPAEGAGEHPVLTAWWSPSLARASCHPRAGVIVRAPGGDLRAGLNGHEVLSLPADAMRLVLASANANASACGER